MNDRSYHSQAEKIKQYPKKYAEVGNMTLHGVEWDPLIVHRTHVTRSSEDLTSTGVVYNTQWLSGLGGFLVVQQPDAHSVSNPGLTNIFLYNFSFLCHFPCQFQKMFKYEKFDQNIWCGSRVMSIFTKRPRPTKMMLPKACHHFAYN